MNDNWEELKVIRDDLTFTALAYKVDNNNQIKMKVNYSNYYGKLEKGTYRIVKTVYDEIDFYSNEFEIK